MVEAGPKSKSDLLLNRSNLRGDKWPLIYPSPQGKGLFFPLLFLSPDPVRLNVHVPSKNHPTRSVMDTIGGGPLGHNGQWIEP